MPTATDLDYMKSKTFRNRKKRRREPAESAGTDEAAHPRHKPYQRARSEEWLRAVDPDTDGDYADPE